MGLNMGLNMGLQQAYLRTFIRANQRAYVSAYVCAYVCACVCVCVHIRRFSVRTFAVLVRPHVRSQQAPQVRHINRLLFGRSQACRLPALVQMAVQPLKRSKPSKYPSKTGRSDLLGLANLKALQKRFGTPNRAGKSYPKATSIASSGRSSLPFARRSQPTRHILLGMPVPQPTATPRPHQWLLMGVQACRLPAPKPLKPLKTPKTPTTP